MPKLIMVVDDNEVILELYHTLLEEEGYQVSSFAYAPLNLELIKQLKPDLAILDLLFRNEDLGWQLIQAMKLEPITARIPIILCTADMVRVKPLQARLREKKVLVVMKPFDVNELLEAVRKSLETAEYPDDFATEADAD